MRKTFTQIALATGLVLGAQVQAHGLHVHGEQCSFNSDYDVHVTDAGVAFSRDSGKPDAVFMHDGRLRVDGHEVATSEADAGRLRQYEGQVRALLPEVAGIAREGLDIGFSAMTAVATTFAETSEERSRLLVRLNRDHAAALKRIDASLGSGIWTQHEMEGVLEDGIEGAVSELVSTVTAGAVKAALSGDQAKIAALEARADSLDRTIDKEVDARADMLDARAQALCPKLATLERLQEQWQFRLPDGSALKLIDHRDDEDRAPAKEKIAFR